MIIRFLLDIALRRAAASIMNASCGWVVGIVISGRARSLHSGVACAKFRDGGKHRGMSATWRRRTQSYLLQAMKYKRLMINDFNGALVPLRVSNVMACKNRGFMTRVAAQAVSTKESQVAQLCASSARNTLLAAGSEAGRGRADRRDVDAACQRYGQQEARPKQQRATSCAIFGAPRPRVFTRDHG
jgi:hypothetical protein